MTFLAASLIFFAAGNPILGTAAALAYGVTRVWDVILGEDDCDDLDD